MHRIKEVFEGYLLEYLSTIPQESPFEKVFKHALKGPSKRIRPLFVLCFAEAIGKKKNPLEAAKNASLAIELFHTASLIADDLPCMDNAETRRGDLSTHRAFGEATSLLASYALIAEGYRLISMLGLEHGYERSNIAVEMISKKLGIEGACLGQNKDIFSDKEGSEEFFLAMCQEKTATLFEVSFMLGWLFGGGDLSQTTLVQEVARHFGMAFQLADDLDDAESDTTLGRLNNLALVLGKDKAEEMFHVEQAAFYRKLGHLPLVDTDTLVFFAATMRKNESLCLTR